VEDPYGAWAELGPRRLGRTPLAPFFAFVWFSWRRCLLPILRISSLNNGFSRRRQKYDAIYCPPAPAMYAFMPRFAGIFLRAGGMVERAGMGELAFARI
jgi:hypothetical protein